MLPYGGAPTIINHLTLTIYIRGIVMTTSTLSLILGGLSNTVVTQETLLRDCTRSDVCIRLKQHYIVLSVSKQTQTK